MTFSAGIMQTFGDFLIGDAQLLKSINKHPFTTSATSWHFTLPALHVFMGTQERFFSELDYKQFRQKLFHSPINEQLKILNGKIVIIDNQHNVDLTTYALSRVDKD
mgnify:CR=1 FL=1